MTVTVQQQTDSRTRIWFGLDVSSKWFDAGWRIAGGAPPQKAEFRKMKTRRFDRTREGAAAFARWMRKTASNDAMIYILMESTGHYGGELAVWLRDLVPEAGVCIACPDRIRSYISGLGICEKTDKMDARGIACFGALSEPVGLPPVEGAFLSLRILVREHEALVRHSTVAKNQVHARDSDFTPGAVRRSLLKRAERRLRALKDEMDEIERQMRDVVDSDAELARQVFLISTIDSVGFFSAATIVGELGDLRRYATSRQLTAAAGLNPVACQSGDKTWRSFISRRGSPRARRILYLCAMSACRADGRLGKRFRRFKERGKPGKVALVANMRVLLTIMRAVVVTDKPYDADYLEKQNSEPAEKDYPHDHLSVSKTAGAKTRSFKPETVENRWKTCGELTTRNVEEMKKDGILIE